jgi:hypothetical protein
MAQVLKVKKNRIKFITVRYLLFIHKVTCLGCRRQMHFRFDLGQIIFIRIFLTKSFKSKQIILKWKEYTIKNVKWIAFKKKMAFLLTVIWTSLEKKKYNASQLLTDEDGDFLCAQ